MKKLKQIKRLATVLAFLTIAAASANGQGIVKQGPPGFDTLRTNIPHGKIDTISYHSVTVGNNRRALIYTPPGFSKKEKISCIVFIAWYRWR